MSDHRYLAAVPILLAALAYAPLAPWLRSRPRGQRRSLDRVARQAQLPVPARLRPRLERRLRDDNLGADLGAAAAVALTAVWGLTFGRSTAGDGPWFLIVFSAALVGAAVGAGIAAVRDAGRPREDAGPRVARPVSPTLGDYIAPVELQGGRAVAVLPTILLACLVVLGSDGVTASALVGPATGTVLGLLALAFFEIGGRRILDAPQAAGSDLELAWSDAIRARTLRAVVTVPITVGAYATIGALSAFDVGGVELLSPIGIGSLILFLLVGIALMLAVIWSLSGAPHRYFRRRLWPADRPARFRATPTVGRS